MSGFLDKVELAFTCPLRWEKLTGGDKEKFCGQCQKHVTNLSAMTRHEAASFLRNNRGPICVRVEVDDTGRSVHRPSLSIPAMSLSLMAGAPIHSCNETPTMMGAPPPMMMGEVAVQVEAVHVDPLPETPPAIPETHAMLGQAPVRPLMGKVASTREMMGDYAAPVDDK